jgi:hypothetical protein
LRYLTKSRDNAIKIPLFLGSIPRISPEFPSLALGRLPLFTSPTKRQGEKEKKNTQQKIFRCALCRLAILMPITSSSP